MTILRNFRTLIELFNRTLTRAGLAEKDCLQIVRTDREEQLTFGQLCSEARDFAVHLVRNKNIQIGDKIALLGNNCADWDIAFWGIVLAGAVPVLIDPQRRIEGVKKHIIHTDTKLLILADDYQDNICREMLREYLRSVGVGVVEMTVFQKPALDDAQTASLLAEIPAEVKADDTAVILCTSGTTGDPREVEITHTNLIANVRGALDVVKITAEDKLGHIIPPHHSFGLTVGKLLPFCVGATNLYTNKYHRIAQLLGDSGITIFVGVPALFAAFARRLEENIVVLRTPYGEQKKKKLLVRLADRYLPALVGRKIVKNLGLRKLRFFISGAAPLPKWVLEAFWRRGLQLREGYGTTEASPVYGFNSNPKKLGSVGKPISTMSVKIVNEQNETFPAGQTGEIVLGGPCIAKGYYKNPKATQTVIEIDSGGVRWLHTGDLGYLDEDGYLFITGRKKYLIVLPGGKKVFPELVELVLSKARYVEELLVVPGYQKGPAGIQPRRVGVKAFVRPAWQQLEADTKLSRQHLINSPDVLKNLLWQSINQCQQDSQELASFEKIPSKNHIEIEVNEFQKTSMGKIKRDSYLRPLPR